MEVSDLRSPEGRLLRVVARGRPAAPEALWVAAHEVRDWTGFVDAATRHRLAPLAWRRLSTAGVELPAPAAEALAARARAGSTRALALAAEWFRVNRALTAAGVPHLPYKGPELSDRLYGQIGLRPSWDLDVVVRRDDLARARTVLERAGCPRLDRASAAGDWALAHSAPHVRHARGAHGLPVELHWRFAPSYMGFAAFQGHALGCGLGYPGALPNPELLLVLCLHGAKHRWSALGWVADVAALVGGMGEEERARAVRLAPDYGMTHVLEAGASLATDLLGAPSVAPPPRAAGPDRRARGARRHFMAALGGEQPTLRGHIGLTLSLQPNVGAAVRAIACWILVLVLPKRGDVDAIALPYRLRWLYYLVRPVRLAMRVARGLGRSPPRDAQQAA